MNLYACLSLSADEFQQNNATGAGLSDLFHTHNDADTDNTQTHIKHASAFIPAAAIRHKLHCSQCCEAALVQQLIAKRCLTRLFGNKAN